MAKRSRIQRGRSTRSIHDDLAIVEAAVRSAAEQVGIVAFHALYKTTVEGLPPVDATGLALWNNSYVTRLLSPGDEKKVAQLALRIEAAARSCVDDLLGNKAFLDALKRDFARGTSRARSVRRSEAFESELVRNPTATAKQHLKALERSGKIIDEGEHYKNVLTGKTIKKTSIAAKFSRMRQRLRAT